MTPAEIFSQLQGSFQDFFDLSASCKRDSYYLNICYDELCEFICIGYKNFTSKKLEKDDPFTESLARRMLLFLTSDASELESKSKIRDRINLLNNQNNDEIFRISSCSEDKESVLVVRDGIKKSYTFFIDWETGRLFVKVKGRETDFNNRQNDGYSMQTYCLAESVDLEHLAYDRRSKSWGTPQETEEDSLDNLIVCDRFDTKHINADAKHPNNLDKLKTSSPAELQLFEKYFSQQVYGNGPHFHFYSEMLSLSLKSNNASLAMEPYKLAIYLQDLAKAAEKPKSDTSGILKYPLCMPYLDIALGRLLYENENFLDTAKALVSAYSRSSNNTKITELFAHLDKLVPTSNSPISKVAGHMAVVAEVLTHLPPKGQVELIEAFEDGYKKTNQKEKGKNDNENGKNSNSNSM